MIPTIRGAGNTSASTNVSDCENDQDLLLKSKFKTSSLKPKSNQCKRRRMHYCMRESDIITRVIEKYRKCLNYIRLVQDELQHKHGLVIYECIVTTRKCHVLQKMQKNMYYIFKFCVKLDSKRVSCYCW
jgi:hypothetical protein